MGLFSPRLQEDSTGQKVRETTGLIRRYFKLLFEDFRLTAAEKLTILFSAVTFIALLLIVGTVALVFISIGVGHWLAATVAPLMAYLYIAGFYVLLLLVLIIFKRQLLVDPICRFVTRLIVEPPKSESSHPNKDEEYEKRS